MRMTVLSVLLAVGLGLAGSTGASAANFAVGINQAAQPGSLVEQAAVVCRKVRVCRRTPRGAVCRWERVCRRVR